MIEKVLPKLRVATVVPSDRGEVRILVSPQKTDAIEPSEHAPSGPEPLPTSTPYPPNIQPMEDNGDGR
jgi:hypothetical protein